MGIKIKICPHRLKTEGDFYKESRKLLEKGIIENYETFL